MAAPALNAENVIPGFLMGCRKHVRYDREARVHTYTMYQHTNIHAEHHQPTMRGCNGKRKGPMMGQEQCIWATRSLGDKVAASTHSA